MKSQSLLLIPIYLLLGIIVCCSKETLKEEDNVSSELNKDIAIQVLKNTNVLRKEKGLTELSQNEEMDKLATYHSENMVSEGFFDHVDTQGNSPSSRADLFGYKWSTIGENIAKIPWFENVISCGDTRSKDAIAQCVVDGWKNSPGHYRNIIGDYTELGVGVVFSQDSMVYFTQVFRTP